MLSDKKQKIAYLCMVSNEVIACILPLLQINQIDRCILLATKKMALEAERLQKFCKGINVEAAIDEILYNDIEKVESIVKKHESNFIREGFHIMANITTGTKLMSLGMYRALEKSTACTMLYIDTESNQSIFIDKDKFRTEPLEDKLKVPHFFNAYGLNQGEYASSFPLDASTLHAIFEAGSKSKYAPIGKMNELANRKQTKRNLKTSLQEPDDIKAKELFKLFEKAGCLKIEEKKLHFTSEEARFCTGGGWFELFCYNQLKKLQEQGKITDLKQNITVSRAANKSVKNEIDIAFTAKNIFYFVECKTANMQENIATDNKSLPYKIETLARDIGGLMSKAILISYRPVSKFIKARLEYQRITIIEKEEVSNIEKILKL